MSVRIARDPSPFRSGLVHSALGAFTLTCVLGASATAMHVMGDPDAAGPTVRMALFDDAPTDAPQLNPRLPGYQEAVGFSQAGATTARGTQAGSEPDLGVEYNGAVRMTASAAARPNETSKGIRINGKTVLPGQTYSQITEIGDTADADATQADEIAPAVADLLPPPTICGPGSAVPAALDTK